MERAMPIGKLYHDKICVACGQCATPEGHDPCLGTLPGVKFACCGHDMREGYLVFDNNVTIRFIVTQIEHYSDSDYSKQPVKGYGFGYLPET